MSARSLSILGSALVASSVLLGLPGQATAAAASDGASVVVRGTAFPDPDSVGLSFVGCATMPAVSGAAPQAYVEAEPGPAPERSLGFDPAGGSAAGAMFAVPSLVGTTTASVDVRAPAGASGVAYAGYQERSASGTQRFWVGRAGLSGTGGWQTIDATKLSYSWSMVDLGTGATIRRGPSSAMSVATFAAGSGGGGGLFTIGFGCDGSAFSIDRLRVGATTYDLEGATTSTSLSGPDRSDAGEPVRLSGSVVDHTGAAVPRATAILEQRVGDGPWRAAQEGEGAAAQPAIGEGAGLAVTVHPERTTAYRFRFADRPSAEGSVSAPHVVTVDEAARPKRTRKPPKQAAPAAPAPQASPQAAAVPEPETAPEQPAEEPTEQPSEQPSEEPVEQPSKEPVKEPEPSREPTEQPEPAAPKTTQPATGGASPDAPVSTPAAGPANIG